VRRFIAAFSPKKVPLFSGESMVPQSGDKSPHSKEAQNFNGFLQSSSNRTSRKNQAHYLGM